jgi:hypothetical protein
MVLASFEATVPRSGAGEYASVDVTVPGATSTTKAFVTPAERQSLTDTRGQPEFYVTCATNKVTITSEEKELKDDTKVNLWVDIQGTGSETFTDSAVPDQSATIPSKATPVADDVIIIEDSEDDGEKKKILVSSISGGGSGDSIGIDLQLNVLRTLPYLNRSATATDSFRNVFYDVWENLGTGGKFSTIAAVSQFADNPGGYLQSQGTGFSNPGDIPLDADAWTIELWSDPSPLNPSDYANAWSKGILGENHIRLYVEESGGAAYAKVTGIMADSTPIAITDTTDLISGYHHVALVYSRVTDQHTFKVYVDNVLSSTNTITGPSGAAFTTVAPHLVGAVYTDSSLVWESGSGSVMRIDDLVFTNGTAKSIFDILNEATTITHPGATAIFNANDDTLDASGNGNDLVTNNPGFEEYENPKFGTNAFRLGTNSWMGRFGGTLSTIPATLSTFESVDFGAPIGGANKSIFIVHHDSTDADVTYDGSTDGVNWDKLDISPETEYNYTLRKLRASFATTGSMDVKVRYYGLFNYKK